jgi:catechol 2,3-dioxygenase-like lactoylglutathione lyase family enzyme
MDPMRIHRLGLATAEIEGQAEFWGGRLGLPVERVGEDAIEVRLRDSTIAFRRAPAEIDPRYHFAINVPAGSIEAAAAWIEERGELLLERGDVGAGAVYFLDPAGNVAELIANPDLAGGGEEFGPGSLIDIAEIGIAAADPLATRDALCELFAVGDRRAVVIIAPVGRGWIPIDLPARPLPTEIVAYGSEDREVTLPEGPYRLRISARSGRC